MNVVGKNADIPGTSGARLPGVPANVPSLGNFPPLVSTGQIRDIRGQYIGGFSSSWLGFTNLGKLPSDVGESMREGLESALEAMQEQMVEWAKEHAPWQDQTGDARAELNSPPIRTNSDGSKTLVLAHGVEYGIFLETMNGGHFGVIPMTIRHFAALLPQMQAYYVRTKVPA